MRGLEVRIPIDGGAVHIILSQLLAFETDQKIGTEEATQLCCRLNSPILNSEYQKDAENEITRKLSKPEFGRVGCSKCLNIILYVFFRSRLDRLSPFFCLSQAGVQQLQRVVNHYVTLALEV